MKRGFRQHHVNSFVDVDDLGHVQIGGQPAQSVGVLARGVGALTNERDYLPQRLLGGAVETAIDALGDDMGGRLGARRGECRPFADDQLEGA